MIEKTIKVFVPGLPVTQGSMRAVMNKYTGRTFVIHNKPESLYEWRACIGMVVKQAMREKGIMEPIQKHDPVYFNMVFFLSRPKGHYGTGKNAGKIKDSSPKYHVTKPDIDKLIRAVQDALKGIVYNDDSQVCSITASKVYSETPGVSIMIRGDQA